MAEMTDEQQEWFEKTIAHFANKIIQDADKAAEFMAKEQSVPPNVCTDVINNALMQALVMFFVNSIKHLEGRDASLEVAGMLSTMVDILAEATGGTILYSVEDVETERTIN